MACTLAPAPSRPTVRPAAAYVMAMPVTYRNESQKPRPALVLAPPSTTLVRMGTIGNTQGVNVRPRPSRKKIPMTAGNERPEKKESSLLAGAWLLEIAPSPVLATSVMGLATGSVMTISLVCGG